LKKEKEKKNNNNKKAKKTAFQFKFLSPSPIEKKNTFASYFYFEGWEKCFSLLENKNSSPSSI